jgi:uncharacterized oxidoreductase
MPTLPPHALKSVTRLIARRMGSDDGEAEHVADHLVRTNLAGHDSHGVGMLPTYVRLLRSPRGRLGSPLTRACRSRTDA